MSVNGIEIKVGQKWRTRDGDTVFVTHVRADLPEYPVHVLNRGSRTADGFVWDDGDRDGGDLIELIEGSPPLPAPATDDGWIGWTGGECPVGYEDPVEFRQRNGVESHISACYIDWRHRGHPNDIVAYRVVEAAPKAEQPDADTLASETLQALGWRFDGMGWVQDEDTPVKSALDVQEGGNHYKSLGIQPVEYIEQNKLDYFQGNVVKYITRHKAKNGIEDVKKAAHYCQLIIELQYGKAGV